MKSDKNIMGPEYRPEYRRYRRYFLGVSHLYKQKKVRAYAGIILSLFAVSFFIIFAIKPTMVTIASLKKQTKDQQEIVTKLENKILAISQAQEVYANTVQDFPLIDEALPKDPQAITVAAQIESMARVASVSIVKLSFSKIPIIQSSKSATETNIAFTLSASGEFNQLQEFLRLFTNTRRAIVVSGIDIKLSPEKGTQFLLDLTANANAHYLTSAQSEKRQEKK